MGIVYQSENIKLPDIKKKETSRWIEKVASLYNKSIGDVNYIFCDDDKIIEVNRKFLDHDFYTDIITFDYSEDNIISGDIFISLDTVLSNSQKYNTEYKEELMRVIIHGILHLCDIDDRTDTEELEMRKAEENALKILKDNV